MHLDADADAALKSCLHAIAVDRGNNLGAYSALALGMSRLLVDGTAASALHKKVVAPLRMAREQEDEALDFLETQGAAAALGFRRAWPAEAPDPVLEKVLDGRDVEFGRRLAAAGLLLPSLDARTEAPAAWVRNGSAIVPVGPCREESQKCQTMRKPGCSVFYYF